MNLRMLGLGLLLAACATDEVMPTSDIVVRRAISGPELGEPCDHDHGHGCGPGLTCMTYFGVGGLSGPEFETCEIGCEKADCPGGLTCGVWTEGPGHVCR